jgi:hypothetical protein
MQDEFSGLWKWLLAVAVGTVFIFTLAMCAHNAYAKGHPDGGMTIIPRGPGGPPVVITDDDAGPRWKIVVTMEGPPGKQVLTYGSKEEGAHWYASQDECMKALKGGDAKLAAGLKLLRAQLKQMKMPVEVTVECKPDNSV